ncbi:uncharacterized protein PFL1_05464 [Pseudozyma flocculosa PF-1]|uniref:DAPG hydrolase PhiG domain-containing protein n=2 Tax=Pseudozyma flocculosa TaxID=84751 RepID=A0A5C3FF50_9BASI|nr:uncharacterized protein PFL1_05464 [Pseudozyma flocculosa PF-1]EPQ26829.1 hypothetical protein PFL1_05464 [Pseudozyma flocculosa PF-1]SPO42101.1 uncharacterized protein PSFLO_07584 [Pseudozyma flocculosa]
MRLGTTPLVLLPLLVPLVWGKQASHADIMADAPPGMIPYTYYQPELIDQYSKNAVAVRGKPYERFFTRNLYVRPSMVEPSRSPICCETQALQPDLSDLDTILVPASTTLQHEDAWCAYNQSGAGYVSSRTYFPGATADMVQWWMWWHSGESERYMLWHPYAHVSISSSASATFDNPLFDDKQKLYGSVHTIREIIGDTQEDIAIHWFPPAHFGLDESRFEQAGVVADACGEIYLGPLKVIDMIHLWYKSPDGDGLVLRSRYFLASRVSLLGLLPLDPIASPLGIQKAFVGRHIASLQFAHDQQEFTHLGGFLPHIYRRFAKPPSNATATDTASSDGPVAVVAAALSGLGTLFDGGASSNVDAAPSKGGMVKKTKRPTPA